MDDGWFGPRNQLLFSYCPDWSITWAPAYALLIFLRFWYLLTRRVNSIQWRVLNRLTGKRWGKEGVPRETRISVHYLYLGNILFGLPAFILNILIEGIDKVTPLKLKMTEAAIFGVIARKVAPQKSKLSDFLHK